MGGPVNVDRTRHLTSIITITDQGIVSAANFLTGVLIGRAATPEQFGLYLLGFSIVNILIELQTAVIQTPYMIYSPRFEGLPLARYTGSSLVHELSFAVIAMAGVGACGLVLGTGSGSTEIAPVLLAVAFAGTFILFRDYARRIMFTRLKMASALILDIGTSLLQIGALGALAAAGLLGAATAYLALGVASLVTITVWLAAQRRMFSVSLPEAARDFRKNWHMGSWVAFSGALWALIMYLYPWLLTAFHGPSAAGVLAACLGIVSLGNPVLLGVQNHLAPRIARLAAASDRRTFVAGIIRRSLAFTALMLPLPLLLVIAGDRLIRMLYGDSYAGHGLTAAILGLNLAFSAGGFCLGRALFAIDRADLDFAVNTLAVLLLFTGGLWAAYRYGTLGVALGMTGITATTDLIRFLLLTAKTESQS